MSEISEFKKAVLESGALNMTATGGMPQVIREMGIDEKEWLTFSTAAIQAGDIPEEAFGGVLNILCFAFSIGYTYGKNKTKNA